MRRRCCVSLALGLASGLLLVSTACNPEPPAPGNGRTMGTLVPELVRTAGQGMPRAASGSDDLDASCTTTPRDPALWPFAADDPWNVSLGSGARYAAVSSPEFDLEGGGYLNCQRWSHPVYIARATDPLRTFYRDGEVCATVRVPPQAAPDPEADAHLHLIDEEHGRVVESWLCRPQGDDFITGACVVNDLRGPGVYDTWHGVRAYGGSALGGLIRAGELKHGIPHALAAAVRPEGLNKDTPNGMGFVWPASSADSGFDWRYGESGNVHMGSLLAIPPAVDLSALGLSAAGLAVGRALQDYGVYITDIGDTNMVFYAEPAATGDVVEELAGDLHALVALLQVVTNNSSTRRGGGGTRRRCPAPPFLP